MSLYYTYKGHTMLTQLAAYFNKMFYTPTQTTYGSELERYIVSKGPQSVAEIDHWTRQYDREQQRSWL